MKTIFLIIKIFIIISLVFSDRSEAQMFWNQACSFAGSNSSYIAVRPSSYLNITGSFTLEAWVNPANATSPSFQIIMQKRNAGANGYTLYLNHGKVAIRTGSSTRLIGQTVIPSNQWTHIAGVFDLSLNKFTTFVNGIEDSSVIKIGAAPLPNSDSLWIGKGANSPFAGMMDEVRIWSIPLSDIQGGYIYTPLYANLNNLALSVTFQDNESSGSLFNLSDWTLHNFVFNRGVTGADLKDRPLPTIQMNDCIKLNLTNFNDYLSAPDVAAISPTSQLTLSAWIFPLVNSNRVILHKGSISGGQFTDYRLSLYNGHLEAWINGNFNFNTDDTIPLNRWSHVAFTYKAGSYIFYLNGKPIDAGNNNVGNINDGTDSLYIGGAPTMLKFEGYIDEVRILPTALSSDNINRYLFQSIDEGNYGGGNYAVYNFDGSIFSNNGLGPKLNFRNSASFALAGAVSNTPQSPMNRADDLNFPNGYYLKTTDRRIPASGNSGNMISDSLMILRNDIISDINVFIGLNHYEISDLEIFLYSPNGSSVQLFDNFDLKGNGEHLTTIFNDQSDSSLGNEKYVSFSPRIKPFQNINSIFNGQSAAGVWRLEIVDNFDNSFNDTGRVYGWGIQINNEVSKPYRMKITNLIQGFYDPGSNLLTTDSMKYTVRSTQSPYTSYGTAMDAVNISGTATTFITNLPSGIYFPYYLVLNHRNSIETWSTQAYFDRLTFQTVYDFTDSASASFGNNMIQVDNSPVNFAIYGGDSNQDGAIDLTDVTAVYNDAANFASGYIVTDMTGDNFVDITDLTITYNNSSNFVTKITP